MRNERPIVIERLDGGPSLIVEEASALASSFFSNDVSSVGTDAYDQRTGRGDPNRITVDDVQAINRTMRARSAYSAWESLTSAGALPWLAALDPSWDLVEFPDQEWERLQCTKLLEETFATAIAKYRGPAVATKVLHLKRPALFPVLDALVVEQIGGTGRSEIILLLHLRAQAQRNRAVLRQIQTSLEEVGYSRTLIRILDALLWSSHPKASLAAKLHGWERVFRPATGASPVATSTP